MAFCDRTDDLFIHLYKPENKAENIPQENKNHYVML